MEKPNKQELQAMAELGHNPQHQKIIGWMKRSLAAQQKRNDNVNDDLLLKKGVGRSQVLSEIIETTEGANEAIRKLRDSSP